MIRGCENTVLKLVLEIYIFKNKNSFIYRRTWSFSRSIRIKIHSDNIYLDIMRSTKSMILKDNVHSFCKTFKGIFKYQNYYIYALFKTLPNQGEFYKTSFETKSWLHLLSYNNNLPIQVFERSYSFSFC